MKHETKKIKMYPVKSRKAGVRFGGQFNWVKGFSMVESMVAIAIVSLGVVAAIGLVSKGLGETNDGRNQVVAALLAQEGVELVRNLRDSNWIGGTGGSFHNFPGSDEDDCVIHYDHDILTAIDCAGADKYLALSSGFYNSNTAGRYQRKIIVAYYDSTGGSTNNAGAETAEITSVVVWKDAFPTDPISATSCNSASKCSYAKTTLSKWRR